MLSSKAINAEMSSDETETSGTLGANPFDQLRPSVSDTATQTLDNLV